MKSKLLLLAISLSLLLTLTPQVQAVDTEPFVLNHEVNTYIETRIIVSYTFTQNVTSDAYAAGQSVWQVNVDPLTTSFVTSAADKFTWHLTVSYSMIVDQDVTVAIFSGSEAVDSLTLHVKTDKLILNFDITVTEQPRPPTAEELSALTIEEVTNHLSEQNLRLMNTVRIIETSVVLQWIALAILGAAILITVWKVILKKPVYEERG